MNKNTLSNPNILRGLALGTIGSLALTGCTGINREDLNEYRVTDPNVIGIEVCDGAILRDAPAIAKDILEHGVQKAKIDLGNAPEDTCVTIPSDTVYEPYEWKGDANESWFCIPESDAANTLTNTSLDRNNSEGVVCVNWQRGGLVYEEEQ